MTKTNIFNQENLDLFNYGGDGVEFFDRVMFSLGYRYDDLKTVNARENALKAIEQLLNADIIFVYNWGDDNDYFKSRILSVNEKLLILRAKWVIGTDVPEFYNLVTFSLTDWYIEALELEGMTHTTDWKWFVENKIGNLEQWIEEKRPKK